MLGGAIAPLFENTDELIKVLDGYDNFYWNKYYNMMAGKLGLDEVRPKDTDLFNQFERVLTIIKPDMTIFYQLLGDVDPEDGDMTDPAAHFSESFYGELKDSQRITFNDLLKNYIKRIKSNTINRDNSVKKMKENNPRFILRNYLLHQAAQDLETGDDVLFTKLQSAMKEPYSNKHDEFFVKRPAWAAQKAGCSMLSCSS